MLEALSWSTDGVVAKQAGQVSPSRMQDAKVNLRARFIVSPPVGCRFGAYARVAWRIMLRQLK